MSPLAQLVSLLVILSLLISLVSWNRHFRRMQITRPATRWFPRLPLILALLCICVVLCYKVAIDIPSIPGYDWVPPVRLVSPEDLAFVEVELSVADNSVFPKTLKVTLTSVGFTDFALRLQGKAICAVGLGLGYTRPRSTHGSRGPEYTEKHALEVNPFRDGKFCFTSDFFRAQRLSTDIVLSYEIPMDSLSFAYSYPYDDSYLFVVVPVHLVLYNEQGEEIDHIRTAAHLLVRSQLRNFSVRVDDQQQFSLLLARPSFPKFVTWLLISVIVIAIVLLPLFPDPGSIGQVAIGIGFSIWATRSALVPSEAPGFIAIDRILLFLHGVLIFAVGASIILVRYNLVKGTPASTGDS